VLHLPCDSGRLQEKKTLRLILSGTREKSPISANLAFFSWFAKNRREDAGAGQKRG
jgi:hypothetical protein